MSKTTLLVAAGLAVSAVAVPVLALGAIAATPAAGTALDPATVPAAYAAAISDAAASCDGVGAPVLAAQLAIESGWDPRAVSAAGAQGLAQFMPATWAAYGGDTDGDGDATAFDPEDAIWAAARYDCALKAQLAAVPGDTIRNVLAAYNAGPYAVIDAGGVPGDPAVQAYVETIVTSAPTYAAPVTVATMPPGGLPTGTRGLAPNALNGYLLVRQNWGITDIGGYATSGHTYGSDHYTGHAIDLMLLPIGPDNTALGWQIASYFQANAKTLGVKYIIWQARSWAPHRAEQGWRPYTNPTGNTGPTFMHLDHIHVSFI